LKGFTNLLLERWQHVCYLGCNSNGTSTSSRGKGKGREADRCSNPWRLWGFRSVLGKQPIEANPFQRCRGGRGEEKKTNGEPRESRAVMPEERNLPVHVVTIPPFLKNGKE